MKASTTAAEKAPLNSGKRPLGAFLGNNYVYVAFIALLIFGAFASPVFMTVNNITTVLLQNSIGGFVAIGMLFVVITGGIDLSVGSFVAISVCFVSGFIQDGLGMMAVVLVLLICIGCGGVTGVLVSYAKVAPFIATLAMMTILKGVAYMYQVGANRRIDGTFLPRFIQSSLFGIPIPVWLLAIVFAISVFILNKIKPVIIFYFRDITDYSFIRRFQRNNINLFGNRRKFYFPAAFGIQLYCLAILERNIRVCFTVFIPFARQ